MLTSYESSLEVARAEFAESAAVSRLFDAGLAAERLELFLIYFSALGIQMTEPVEGWIRRAGERCRELGLADLAGALEAHAKHEAGHEALMRQDLALQVGAWNRRVSPQLDAARLEATASTPGVSAYQALHEEVIASDAPFGQIAIEYEIEMLSVRFGPRLINRCVELVGRSVLDGLSFLREHVSLDVGHTAFNRKQMERLLAQYPGLEPELVAAGSRALAAYRGFLGDCWRMADATA